jgi:hypothetical protein
MPPKKKSKAENPPNSALPNIAFVGSKDGREPLMLINNGHSTIVMPADQDKPFFHLEAKTICKLFPLLYKPS